MKTNYHTHTYRCGHAIGTDEQYVLAAIEAGLDELGFSDHMPYPDAYNPGDRMAYDQMNDYIESINFLKEKYKDKIKIYLGFELEFYPERIKYYEEMLDKVDYLICGQHYKILDVYGYDWYTSDEDVLVYASQVVGAIESGLVKMIAHPSYFMLGRKTWSEACSEAAHLICKAAEMYKVPLEINLKGTKYGKSTYNGIESYRYPNLMFWQIASNYMIDAIVSADAHAPIYLMEMDFFETLKQDFIDLGINIIDHLEI